MMSPNYICYVCLDALFNQEMLLMLMKKGKELGFEYFDDELKDQNLSIENFLAQIIKYDEKNNSTFETYKELIVKYQHMFFSLKIYKNNYDAIEIGFSPIDNDLNARINLSFCMQVLLRLCEDFPILKIKTTRFE